MGGRVSVWSVLFVRPIQKEWPYWLGSSRDDNFPVCHPEAREWRRVEGEARDLSVAHVPSYGFLSLFGHPGLTPVEMTRRGKTSPRH